MGAKIVPPVSKAVIPFLHIGEYQLQLLDYFFGHTQGNCIYKIVFPDNQAGNLMSLHLREVQEKLPESLPLNIVLLCTLGAPPKSQGYNNNQQPPIKRPTPKIGSLEKASTARIITPSPIRAVLIISPRCIQRIPIRLPEKYLLGPFFPERIKFLAVLLGKVFDFMEIYIALATSNSIGKIF